MNIMQTLSKKVFAENGELFECRYQITSCDTDLGEIFGIRIEKYQGEEDAPVEVDEIKGVTQSLQQIRYIADKLAEHLVTPMGLIYVCDELFNQADLNL